MSYAYFGSALHSLFPRSSVLNPVCSTTKAFSFERVFFFYPQHLRYTVQNITFTRFFSKQKRFSMASSLIQSRECVIIPTKAARSVCISGSPYHITLVGKKHMLRKGEHNEKDHEARRADRHPGARAGHVGLRREPAAGHRDRAHLLGKER